MIIITMQIYISQGILAPKIKQTKAIKKRREQLYIYISISIHQIQFLYNIRGHHSLDNINSAGSLNPWFIGVPQNQLRLFDAPTGT